MNAPLVSGTLAVSSASHMARCTNARRPDPAMHRQQQRGRDFTSITKFVSMDHGSQIAGWAMALGKASTMMHPRPSSIAYTSFRMHWSFRTFCCVSSICLDAPAIALISLVRIQREDRADSPYY